MTHDEAKEIASLVIAFKTRSHVQAARILSEHILEQHEPIVWPYEDAPFNAIQVRALLDENSRLRSTLECGPGEFSSCEHPEAFWKSIEINSEYSVQRLATWCSQCGSINTGVWRTPIFTQPIIDKEEPAL